ncbi:MAG: NADH-quinone oxidoreductase subunit C/D, partial [Pseudomonas formosensis]|nr:NADH-quinone oxidoreductase subunit C/D [Halopseudomonas formosensis]
MTADQALHIPPYKGDDHRVIAELGAQFGADAITVQPTLTGVPVVWVAREQLPAVLRFLRQLPQPYVMLYDLHGVDER